MIHLIKNKTKTLIDTHKHLYAEHKWHLALHTLLALITGVLLHIAFPPMASHATPEQPLEHVDVVFHAAAPSQPDISPVQQTFMDVISQLDKWIDVSTQPNLPNISLKIIPDSQDGINMFIGTENFGFKPQLADKQNSLPTEGHAIVYINDTYYTKTYTSTLHIPSHHYSEYGDPVVLVMLASNDHTPLLIQESIIYDAKEIIE